MSTYNSKIYSAQPEPTTWMIYTSLYFYIKQIRYFQTKLSAESNVTCKCCQFKLIKTDEGQNLKILSSVDFINIFFIL